MFFDSVQEAERVIHFLLTSHQISDDYHKDNLEIGKKLRPDYIIKNHKISTLHYSRLIDRIIQIKKCI